MQCTMWLDLCAQCMSVSPVFWSASTGRTCAATVRPQLHQYCLASGQGSSGSQSCCKQLLAVVASMPGVVYVLPNLCPPSIRHQACCVDFVTLRAAAAELQSALTQSHAVSHVGCSQRALTPLCCSYVLIATAWNIWSIICTSLLWLPWRVQQPMKVSH